jgi:hypothetical protein
LAIIFINIFYSFYAYNALDSDDIYINNSTVKSLEDSGKYYDEVNIAPHDKVFVEGKQIF